MRFINPKIDYAFKKIFGSEQNHDILISFLNAMIYDGNDTIASITHLNPYAAPHIRGIKKTYLQVQAIISDNTSVIIKMQVLQEEGFEKGLLTSAVQADFTEDDYSSYIDLQPVITLTITEFDMFPELNQLLSRFVLKDILYLSDYSIYDVELVFIELPKFHKQVEELETLTDKWIYFLANASSLEAIPSVLDVVPEIKQAFAIAEEISI
jgi:predicted transposase/invertase (TIGR01784 family)